MHIKESYAVRDGRFANNGWLQELPHPVSKIVWDNYAAISPKTANDLGLQSNDLVEISTGKTSLKFQFSFNRVHQIIQLQLKLVMEERMAEQLGPVLVLMQILF